MIFDEKDNYGFEVERSKNERYELMRDFYRQASEISDLLKKLNGKSHQTYSFDELDSFDMNMSHNINKKLTLKKTYSTEKKLVFEVILLRGGEFKLHSHPNCSEIHFIESGCVFETVGNRNYNELETAIFLTNQEHELIALKDTIMIVTVLKDEY